MPKEFIKSRGLSRQQVIAGIIMLSLFASFCGMIIFRVFK